MVNFNSFFHTVYLILLFFCDIFISLFICTYKTIGFKISFKLSTKFCYCAFIIMKYNAGKYFLSFSFFTHTIFNFGDGISVLMVSTLRFIQM